MSDLERAQEWLESNCGAIVTPDGPTATRLAALLAEVRAEALEDVAEAFASSANRVVKAKGETERTRYANEVVEVLRNRADEVRRG